MSTVSVIIPTWNGAELLREALEALAHQTFADFETIVVDNGSDDHTAAVLAHFPHVRQLRLPVNHGFAVAANAGIRAAAGEYVVLLNNDTRAEPTWLEALVRALREHDDVGSCASKMVLYDRPHLIDSAGDQLGLFASNIGHGARDSSEFQQRRYVLSACAGAAIYRRKAIEEVGLFDERYVSYLEDVDLGIRLQLAGYRCLFVPDAVVRHHGSATSRSRPGLRYYLLMRNSLFVFFQYMPLPRLLLGGPLVVAFPLVHALRVRPHVKWVWRVYAELLREAATLARLRRRWQQRRRINTAAFSSLLASPLARQRRISASA